MRLFVYSFIHQVTDGGAESKIFAVPDFVGDLCKAVASRVRGAVAQCRFDDFHRSASQHKKLGLKGSVRCGVGLNGLCISVVEVSLFV